MISNPKAFEYASSSRLYSWYDLQTACATPSAPQSQRVFDTRLGGRRKPRAEYKFNTLVSRVPACLAAGGEMPFAGKSTERHTVKNPEKPLLIADSMGSLLAERRKVRSRPATTRPQTRQPTAREQTPRAPLTARSLRSAAADAFGLPYEPERLRLTPQSRHWSQPHTPQSRTYYAR